MEYIIVLALLSIIFFCLGLSLGDVLMMLAVLLCAGIVFVGAFFLFSLVVLALSRKVTASFLKMNDEGRYPCAVYKVGDSELKNLFPSEMIMKDKLYVPEKEIKIRRCVLFNAALDKNAVMTIVVGSAVFIPLSAAVIFAMKWFFGF
ncbi:MAG: hypothetical protein J1F03_07100 [Oscillospiraceae bacterium]|nr:hypothetical protein [Oscillospiraceae bacterium]